MEQAARSERFLSRYPGSNLSEGAAVERMRLLATVDRRRAAPPRPISQASRAALPARKRGRFGREAVNCRWLEKSVTVRSNGEIAR